MLLDQVAPLSVINSWPSVAVFLVTVSFVILMSMVSPSLSR
jgi:hypothetical protein